MNVIVIAPIGKTHRRLVATMRCTDKGCFAGAGRLHSANNFIQKHVQSDLYILDQVKNSMSWLFTII